MSARLLSLVLVVASLTSYHLAQRAMPGGLRPAPLFAFVYGVGAIVMLVATTITGQAGFRAIGEAASHWSPWLLVLAVCGIELGFYAMYRSGWGITTASVSTQTIVAALLVVLGLWRFDEHLTPSRFLGLGMCVIGAGLVAR